MPRRLVSIVLCALLVMALVPAYALAETVAPDAYELDDTPATANAIVPGESQDRSIDDSAALDSSGTPVFNHDPGSGGFDQDWASFSAVTGTTYEFETTGTADTALVILDYASVPSGRVVTFNNDREPGVSGAYVSWTAPADGTYFVAVLPGGGAAQVGTYTLESTATAGVPLLDSFNRISGADRYQVAYQAAKTAFPGWKASDGGPVTDVVIACGEDRAAADPLSAAALAGIYQAPLLLVQARTDGVIPRPTLTALAAIRAGFGGKVRIHVVGGAGSVTTSVYNKLKGQTGGAGIERLYGADRYSTAGAVADRVDDLWSWQPGNPPTPVVFVADGLHPAAFYDALAAGPLLYNGAIPLLLTAGGSVPTATKSRLTGRFADASEVWVVNSPTYVPGSTLTYIGAAGRLASSTDRARTASQLAQWGVNRFLVRPDNIGVANRLADSLTGGASMGQLGGPLLFANATSVPAYTSAWLHYQRGTVYNGYVLGGTASVSSATFAALENALEK